MAERAESAEREAQAKPLRVVLVDDNPDDRVLTARELEREFGAIAVEQVAGPESLKQVLEAGEFDLVITDYQLHWSNGLEVLRAVKARWPHRPVVMFTGTGSEEIAVEAMKAGLDDYVLKSPKHFRRLPATVRLALARAEERRAREEAEARYQQLVERVPVGLYRTTPEGRILEANPALVAMLGYPSREALLQTSMRDLYADPQERELHLARLEEQEVLQGELRLRRRDGHVIWVRNTVRAVRGEDGQVCCYEGALEDITEEKARAQEVRAILETVPEGVLLLDGELRIRQANPAARELLPALTEAREGEVLRHLGPYSLKRLLEPPEGGRWHEVRLEGPKPRFYEVAAEPLRGAEEGAGWVLVLRDVTREREARQQEEAQARLAAIGQLAAGIAHDFNNILTGILGNLSLAMLSTPRQSQVFQRLSEAEQATLRARDLVQQLLTFAKGGAPVKEVASLEKIIRDSATFACRGSQVRCNFILPKDLRRVEVDPGQISQVIQNLVINAIQAMPAGGSLTIQAENVTLKDDRCLPLPPGKYVKILVKDEGIGIPSEYLPRIFDPYFSTKQTGSGLGLATAYSIIKNHNGYMTVESVLGQGTTFYIYLAASNKKLMSVAESPTNLVHRGQGRILVMDDDAGVRQVAGRILNHLGYDVDFAMDGADAIEKYRAALTAGRPFDLVIMDLTIPGGMGGKEALQTLRQIEPRTRAIVSSGYADDPIMTHYREYGFSGVIKKPYKVDTFSHVLHEVLGHEET